MYDIEFYWVCVLFGTKDPQYARAYAKFSIYCPTLWRIYLFQKFVKASIHLVLTAQWDSLAVLPCLPYICLAPCFLASSVSCDFSIWIFLKIGRSNW